MQQQGQDARTPAPLQAAGFHSGQDLTRQAPSTDLAAVPQLAAPPILQQAAELINTAVNSRMHSPEQQRWQQLRHALAAALLASAGVAYGSRGGSSTTAGTVRTAGTPNQTVLSGDAGLEAESFEAAVAAMALPATASAPAAAAGLPQPNVRQQPQQQQPQDAAVQWRPSYVLANLYKDGQQSVGSHADRLSTLGPLPTIASLSLGAGRVFRLHPADASVAAMAAAAAAAASGGVGSSRAAVVSSIDIHLPHNSLLIMWPPTQEQWKHEVGGLRCREPYRQTAQVTRPRLASTPARKVPVLGAPKC
jgi:alkylated DNA repair dioxygenase AlkB